MADNAYEPQKIIKTIYEKELSKGKNGVYIFEPCSGRGLFVKVIYEQGWQEDCPIQYDNGKISYDWPERIPQYLKNQVPKAFDLLKYNKEKQIFELKPEV